MQLTVQQAKLRVCMDLTWDCVGLVQIEYTPVFLLFSVREQNALHWQNLELLFTDDFLDKVCDWRYSLDPFRFERPAPNSHPPALWHPPPRYSSQS